MEGGFIKRWQWKLNSKQSRNHLPSMRQKRQVNRQSFPLPLAQEGEWVMIISVSCGKIVREKLTGFGLYVGTKLKVIQNNMQGKILISHQGARLYLGGGMAHKIKVVAIEKGE